MNHCARWSRSTFITLVVFFAALLVVAGAAALLPAIVSAQTSASNPASLTIAGTRNDPPQQRVLFISATTAISGAQALVSDFVRDDNAATITGLVDVAQPPQRIEAGKPLTLTVTVHFENVRSGAYAGTIYLNYDADGMPASLQVPVSITIKDGPGWPLASLFFGVFIAALISIYLGGGRQRDDLAVQLERLAARVTATSDLPDSVRRALRQQIGVSQAKLQTNKVAEAQQSFDSADGLLTTWIGWMESWRALQAQFVRAQQMLQPDAQGSPTYAVEIQRRLREIEEQAPQASDLTQMQTDLNTVIGQINDFLQLDTRRKNLQKILDAAKVTADEKAAYQAQIDQLARQVAGLMPEPRDMRPNYDAIDQTITPLNAELKTKLASGAPESALLGGPRQPASAPAMVVEDVAPQHADVAVVAPRTATATPPEKTGWMATFPWARARLYSFRAAQFLILITLWGWTGFNELYVQNSTFGSDWLSNYFALIAWGFTSESARATLTSLSGRLGVPTDQG